MHNYVDDKIKDSYVYVARIMHCNNNCIIAM